MISLERLAPWQPKAKNPTEAIARKLSGRIVNSYTSSKQKLDSNKKRPTTVAQAVINVIDHWNLNARFNQ